MPASRRTRTSYETAAAWLMRAATEHHAGRISAEQYRQVIEQHRRHADPELVLDEDGPARTV